MKKEQIQALFQQFESICYVYDGIECWSARELQKLLGYSKVENFEKVIDKAKEACNNAGEEVVDHFPDIRKTIPMPKGAEKLRTFASPHEPTLKPKARIAHAKKQNKFVLRG